jgi:pimeloyl-ACP methyl ester carboxylesterase
MTHSRWIAFGGGALALGGAAALTVRHARALAADPQLRQLRAPLAGEVVEAVSADGTRLHVEGFGPEDGPLVVLVPGWTEQLALFDPMTRRLVERGFRVVAYDLRGQGRSQPAGEDDYDIERYGEDLEAVLEAVGARAGGGADAGEDDHRAIVAGHSLGAMSIAAWAADFDVAARARGVMLMNTGLDGLVASNRLIPAVLPAAIYGRLATPVFLANPLPFPAVSTPLSFEAIRFVAFGPDATPAQVAFYEHMLMSCAPRVRAAAGLMLSRLDLLHALPRVTVPAVVVAGDSDRLTPPSHADKIADGLPMLDRLVVLERTGHMGPLERPDELVEEIAALAQRVGAPAGALPT